MSCPKITPICHYAQREWDSLLSTKPSAVDYGQYSSVKGWEWDRLVSPVKDAVRVCLLPSTSLWPGGRLLVLSKRDRVTANLFDRCYAGAAQAVANNMAFLA